MEEKMYQKRPDWADRIRRAREEKGITQRDLVKKFKSNQTTIVYYETGKRQPRIGYLLALMDETGVTGEWLLTGKGGMYGEEKKKVTKEEAIEALYGDKVDEVLLNLLEIIKDPLIRAILYTRAIEHKEKHKSLFDQPKSD
jgi:transcriptional regulator with XRE-family HTH domain